MTRKETKQRQVNEILCLLNEKKIRCTYGAIAGIIGGHAQGVSVYLQPRRPEASWVVNKTTRRPTGYKEDQEHPDLYCFPTILDTDYKLIEKFPGLKIMKKAT